MSLNVFNGLAVSPRESLPDRSLPASRKCLASLVFGVCQQLMRNYRMTMGAGSSRPSILFAVLLQAGQGCLVRLAAFWSCTVRGLAGPTPRFPGVDGGGVGAVPSSGRCAETLSLFSKASTVVVSSGSVFFSKRRNRLGLHGVGVGE